MSSGDDVDPFGEGRQARSHRSVRVLILFAVFAGGGEFELRRFFPALASLGGVDVMAWVDEST